MASIHARIIEGTLVYRPYSSALNQYRGEPMTKEEIKRWFKEHCFSVTDEADKDGFIENRIAIAEQRGVSSSYETTVDLKDPWLGEKKPARKRQLKKITVADKRLLKEMGISTV